MISPATAPLQQIDLPTRTPPSARSAAGAGETQATFAQTLKERAGRPDPAGSTDDVSALPDAEREAQIETTDSADEAQNQPVSKEDGAEAGDAVPEEKPDQDNPGKESSDHPSPQKVDVQAVAQIDTAQPVSPESPAAPPAVEEHTNTSQSAPGLVDAQGALQPAEPDGSGAKNTGLAGSSSTVGSQAATTEAVSQETAATEATSRQAADPTANAGSTNPTDVTEHPDPAKTKSANPTANAGSTDPTDVTEHADPAKTKSANPTANTGSTDPKVVPEHAGPVKAPAANPTANADSTDPKVVPEHVDPAKTPSAPPTDSQDKPKADQAQHAQSSSGDAPQTPVAGRVGAVDGAQSNPDSSLQQGQHRQAESFVRSAERNTLTQPEPETPSASQRLFSATVSRGLEAAMRQKGGAVTIRLKPESLGSLRIQLQISQGSISAQFQATTQRARDLLNEHLSSLRTSLEAKGFGVKSVDVQVHASSPGEQTSGDFGRSREDAAGQAPTQDSGAHGQAHSRREDPDGFPYLNQTVEPFAEAEPIDTGWQVVRAGGVNTIA